MEQIIDKYSDLKALYEQMYRKNVAHKRQEVLQFREECDAYTGSTTCENVDHVIEMQIIHYAATHIIDKHAGLAKCFAKVVNDVDNLNVTSRRINQSKKGPFTAALNDGTATPPTTAGMVPPTTPLPTRLLTAVLNMVADLNKSSIAFRCFCLSEKYQPSLVSTHLFSDMRATATLSLSCIRP
jgi:hypothetical protein